MSKREKTGDRSKKQFFAISESHWGHLQFSESYDIILSNRKTNIKYRFDTVALAVRKKGHYYE